MKILSKIISDSSGWGTKSMLIHNNTLITSGDAYFDEMDIQLWDLETQSLIGKIEKIHDKNNSFGIEWWYYIVEITILKNTNILVSSCSFDNYIKFWSLDTLNKHSDSINNLSPVFAMIQHNNYIIISSKYHSIKYYDISSKVLFKKFEKCHTDNIMKLMILDFNGIFEFLLSGSADSKIKIWNENSNINTLEIHSGTVFSFIQLKYNSEILVSADQKGNIIFLNIIENFKIIKSFKRKDYHNKEYKNCAIMNLLELKKQPILISTSEISRITFWNLENYEIIRNVHFKYGLCSLIISENEDILIFNIKSANIIWK